MLATKFENIRMFENKNFSSFYSKLIDIFYYSFNFREPILDSKVVRKILRYIPERFRPKVTTIEERKDIDLMRINELVGSIQAYDMGLPISQK